LDFELKQNYPNPFNPATSIEYSLKRGSFVTLTVFDVQGRELNIIVREKQSAGTYRYTFDGRDLSSGVYFYSLIADGNIISTKRMVLVK
jgi:hypothetical protein